MHLKLLTFIAVITIALLVFMTRKELPLTSQSITADPQSEDQAFTFMSDVEIISTNAKGIPVSKLNSDTLRHYRDENFTVLSKPVLKVIKADQQRWMLQSDHGVIRDNTLITLSENVIIARENNSSNAINVKTTLLHYDTGKEQIYTNQPVLLTRENLQLNAIGMMVDVAQQRVELNADVRGLYVPAH